jgi:hypothetical protein
MAFSSLLNSAWMQHSLRVGLLELFLVSRLPIRFNSPLSMCSSLSSSAVLASSSLIRYNSYSMSLPGDLFQSSLLLITLSLWNLYCIMRGVSLYFSEIYLKVSCSLKPVVSAGPSPNTTGVTNLSYSELDWLYIDPLLDTNLLFVLSLSANDNFLPFQELDVLSRT